MGSITIKLLTDPPHSPTQPSSYLSFASPSLSACLTVPDIDATDDSDSGPSTYPKRPVRRLADAGILPDFSDDPNNDTDEDIVNVLLDYGRLE
ncbi:hypothetical protein DTO006G7_9761 [Penicillium roqueforti]|nr:hypothetical protein DTO006G7_9761 [Penicillium roqueforti]